VNVLKNDAQAALAVAAASGAAFVRLNVHVGAVVGDQGLLQGDAYAALRYRRPLGTETPLFVGARGHAAVPPGPGEPGQGGRGGRGGGRAGGGGVRGPATGKPTEPGDVKRVRAAVPDCPVLVGSGVTPETVSQLLALADGVIVGTWLKKDGRVAGQIDPAR